MSVPSSGTYLVRHSGSFEYLAVPQASHTAGVGVILWEHYGYAPEQQWTIVPVYDPCCELPMGIHLVNNASGQCLADPETDHTPGRQLVQWPCNDHFYDQLWTHTYSGECSCEVLVNEANDLCMWAAVGGGNGTPVRQDDCARAGVVFSYVQP